MKKIFSLLLFLLLLLCSFSACSSDGTGQQMVFPIDSEPKYLDPQIVSENGAANIIQNCFEGLVTYNESGEIVPAGCEKYTVSSDGKTYVFLLRQDAKWNVTKSAEALFPKGEYKNFDNRVTAADYVFAFRRVADSATGSPDFPYISSIKNANKVHSGKLSTDALGVSSNGDFTLIIELERADSGFLYSLTRPAFVPCNETFFELTKGRYFLSVSNIISNGPFYISNWADNTAITARKSDVYHSSSSVLPSSLYFSFNNEKKQRSEKVKSGIYEVSPVNENQAIELSSEKNITIKSIENSCFALIFNCSDDYLQNAYLRLALASSLDKNCFLEEGKEEAGGIIPKSSLALGASYRERAGIVSTTFEGVNTAKAYFEKAQNALKKDSFSLSVLCDEKDELNVRKVMQNWQSVLGVKSSITVEAVDCFSLQSRIENGDFNLAFSNISFNSDSAIGTLLRFSKSGSGNVFKFGSNRFETLLAFVQSSKSDPEYLSAVKKCEQYLSSAAAIVPIEKKSGYFAEAKGVSGVVYSPGGEFVFFKNAIRK